MILLNSCQISTIFINSDRQLFWKIETWLFLNQRNILHFIHITKIIKCLLIQLLRFRSNIVIIIIVYKENQMLVYWQENSFSINNYTHRGMTLDGWPLDGPDFANVVVWISRPIHTSKPKSASVHGQATGVTHTATLDCQNQWKWPRLGGKYCDAQLCHNVELETKI